MELLKDYPLKSKNTFGLTATAKLFAQPGTIDELIELIHSKVFSENNFFILGGGSNVLFTGNYSGIIVHPAFEGKEIVDQDDTHVLVKAHAGEDWDCFVEWAVNQEFGGIENLSLIPGTVGASPVQNIGAYGVEVGDVIEKVETVELANGKIKEFSRLECQFAYRNSIFKGGLKNQFIITAVYFKLNKKPIFKTHYGSVEAELKKLGETNLKTLRQAVINIRESKLPNPENCPNAGSFFKNPIISAVHANKLKEKFPELIMYQSENEQFKIAAGWLIEFLGWKGKCFGGAAVHNKQALVLVNKNNASSSDVLTLAKQIQDAVYEAFDISLEMEVNVV